MSSRQLDQQTDHLKGCRVDLHHKARKEQAEASPWTCLASLDGPLDGLRPGDRSGSLNHRTRVTALVGSILVINHRVFLSSLVIYRSRIN